MPDLTNNAEFQQKLIQLREQYRKSLANKKADLIAYWESLKSDKDISSSVRNLYNLLHNLSGTGSTFGYFQITEQSRILENIMKSLLSTNSPLNIEQKDQIRILTQSLEAELDNPVEEDYSSFSGKYNLNDSKKDLLIYIVDDDVLFSENLTILLTNSGYKVRTFISPEVILTQGHLEIPDLILMDMVFSEADITGADVISKYRKEFKTDVPVIFISVRDDMEARLNAIRSGCSYYILKPVDTDHLLRIMDIVLNRDRKTPFRVMIIDDDEIILSYYKMVLSSAGFIAEGITHPMQAIEKIDEFNPEVILMDVNMPLCNGIELAQIIRQYRHLMSIPIVFLTRETNFETRNNATDLGADDFLLKPVASAHLIRVVTSRARRFRQLRDLSDELAENEKRTRHIIENVHDVIWSAHPDTMALTFISPSCAAVIGKTPESLIQSHDWRNFVFADDRIFVQSEMRKLSSSDKIDLVYRIIMPDFSVRWVSESISKVQDAADKFVRIDGIIRDITARELDRQIIKRRLTLENELSVFTKALLQNHDADMAFECLLRMTGAKVVQVFHLHPMEIHTEKYVSMFLYGSQDMTGLVEKQLLIENSTHWLKDLKKGNHVFACGLPAKLPASFTNLLLPIFVQKHWWGFLSFIIDEANPYNSNDELSIIKSATDILSNFFEKEKTIVEKTRQDKLLDYAGRISRSLLLEAGFISALRISLNLLREASQYEQVYLLQYDDSATQFTLIIQSISNQLSIIQEPLISCFNQHFSLWQDNLKHKHSVILDYNAIIEHLQFPQANLLNHLIIVPVAPSSSLWGVILFASLSQEHHLSARHIRVLESVADSFGGALIRQQTHDELITAKSLAEQANKSKSEFLANMSHEIRTPMNAIMGFAQVLKHNANSEEQHEFLDLILDSGTKLLSLISDVLDLANVDIGKTYVQKSPVAVQFIIPPLWNKFAIDFSRKGLTPRLSVAQDIPILMTDSDKLTKLVKCLVSNAIKFTEAGFVSLDISYLRTGNDTINLQVVVEDSGIGIDQDKQSVIFDAFEQADNSKTRRYSGIGLGLNLSSKIVKIMGGKIELNSTVGKGSRFVMTLPSQLAEIEKLEAKDDSITVINESIKILAAEDNRINRVLIQKIFEKSDYKVYLVEDGQEAIDFLLQNPDTHLVLMDVHMPVVTGIEATQIIKANPDLKHIPIVALTASALQEDITQCFEAGMDDFLEKPIQTDRLFAILKKWCT